MEENAYFCTEAGKLSCRLSYISRKTSQVEIWQNFKNRGFCVRLMLYPIA